MSWYLYKRLMFSFLYRGLPSEVDPLGVDQLKKELDFGKKVALVCPGENLGCHLKDIELYDCRVGINLACALDVSFSYVFAERVDQTVFGNCQYRMLQDFLKNDRAKVLLKNIWNRAFYPEDRLRNLAPKSMVVRDVPLRGSAILSEQTLLSFLQDKNVGLSNWKSSLFAVVGLLVACGVEEIDIYGANGGNKYFWEASPSIVNDQFKCVKDVISSGVHPTRRGRHDASKVFKQYIESFVGVKVCVK